MAKDKKNKKADKGATAVEGKKVKKTRSADDEAASLEKVLNPSTVRPNIQAFVDWVEAQGGPKINAKHAQVVVTGYKKFQRSPEATEARESAAAARTEAAEARKAAREAKAAERAAEKAEKAEKKVEREKAAKEKTAKATKKTAAASSKPAKKAAAGKAAPAKKAAPAAKGKGKGAKAAF